MQGRGFQATFLFVVSLGCLSSIAQTTVTTTGGTVNSVPKYSASGAIVNSAVTEVNGKVGVGTASPSSTLTIASPAQDGQGTASQGILFTDNGLSGQEWTQAAIYSVGTSGYNGNLIFATDGDNMENFNPTEKMRIDPLGRVGIGTSAPGATLEVNGNVKLSGGSGGTITFPDGSIQTKAAGNNGMTITSSGDDAVILFNNTGTGGRDYMVDSGSGNAGVGAGNFAIWDLNATAARLVVAPSGYIGINTITPQSQLDVNGNIHTSGSIIFPDGSSLNSSKGLTSGGGSSGSVANLPDITDSNGRVGIGTTAPRSTVDIWNGALSVTGTDLNGTAYVTSKGGTAYYGTNILGNGLAVDPYGNVSVGSSLSQASLAVSGAISANQYNGGVFFRSNVGIPSTNTALDPRLMHEGMVSGDGSAPLPYGLNLTALPWNYGGDPITYHAGAHRFKVSGPNTNETEVMLINGTGVGIGTDNPGSKLEVNGGIKLTANSGASITFPDNTVQSTAWNGTIGGEDYADAVDVAGDKAQYEAGDVLMIDSETDRTFRKVGEPYSRLVAGVFSTKPGLVGHLASSAATIKSVPLAMAGIVPAKVSTENGPIRRGDLLVASSTPGYAMKGTDPALLTGAVIGKALGTLAAGKGVIEVLVALQ